MKEFLLFIKSGKTSNRNNYINDFIILFLIVFILGITISFLKGVYFDIQMISQEDFAKLNWKTFLSYVLIIPIIEEIIFRAPLLIPKAKIYSLLISIILIFSSVIYIENEIIQLTLISSIALLEIVYWKNEKFRELLNDFIKRRYFILVILSSVSFGLLHMWNYEKIDLISFTSVIGRIIAGFYFAFIVTKYNLKSSCFLHGINNTIPFIILLLVGK
ncbi:CPBP family glutamic-type intramembrane protease [Mesonia sp.]|uniref:CPBP family glutamic-type intramembrane protease n=1 Tax=Mesonia sp. TaxID=1960830 RepID=UPI003F95B7B1